MSNVADYTYDYTNVQWDASGKPYVMSQSGKRSYLPPAQAAQMSDPRLRQWAASMGQVISRDDSGNATGVVSNASPGSTFAKSQGAWNSGTGQFDQSMNQGGLGGLIEGAAGLAVPLVVGPALAGLAGGAGAFPEPVAGAWDAPTAAFSPTGVASTTVPGSVAAGGAAPIATTTPAWASGGALSGAATGPVASASATGASMASTAAPTGFLGSMKNLLTDPKFLIGTGANVLGGILSSHAAGKAADKQAAAAKQSLDLQRNIYEQNRNDQMPWLNAGRGAVSTLSQLMGVNGINPASTFSQTSPQPQQAVQRSPLAALAGGGGGMVNMRAPDGSTRPVPAAMAAQLEARGAVRV